MGEHTHLTRRALFAATGAGASVVALSACSADGPALPPSGATPAPTLNAGSTIPLTSVPVGGGYSAVVADAPIVLEQPTAGTVVAFSAVCPHQGCVVKPVSDGFECPCHGSKFDGATGAVTHGPAERGLSKLNASVTKGQISVS